MSETDYSEAHGDLVAVLREATLLSHAASGRETTEWRVECGSYAFAKLCAHSLSVITLSPKPGNPMSGRLWDFSSICAITRAAVESYLALFYIAIDPISPEERSFREAVWTFQAEHKRLALLRLANSRSAQLPALQQQVVRLQKAVVDHPYYSRVDPSKQGRIRKGELPILATNSELAERAGVSLAYYRAVYRFLSSYVHTYPYCVSQLASFRAGDPEALRMIAIVLRYCLAFSSLGVRDFLRLFADLPAPPTQAQEIIDTWVFVAGQSGKNGA